MIERRATCNVQRAEYDSSRAPTNCAGPVAFFSRAGAACRLFSANVCEQEIRNVYIQLGDGDDDDDQFASVA